jgi:hypothetical protein
MAAVRQAEVRLPPFLLQGEGGQIYTDVRQISEPRLDVTQGEAMEFLFSESEERVYRTKDLRRFVEKHRVEKLSHFPKYMRKTIATLLLRSNRG